MEKIACDGTKVGMGGTHSINGDSYPFTVIKVVSPKCIEVQNDSVKRISGNFMEDNWKGEYFPNPQGRITVLTMRKNGRWMPKGTPMRSWGLHYSIGNRNYRQDPHF